MRKAPISLILCSLAALLVVAAATARADVIKSGSLQASSDGVNVTIRWATEDESNVVRFEVQRSSGTTGDFATIGDPLYPKGPSLYEFVDHSAFMRTTTIYQYRVMIFFANDPRGTPSQVLTVSHTVSGVRRTWGSIKSLFR